jgi:LmbE family N-acetylglucosaminyl deacetylase
MRSVKLKRTLIFPLLTALTVWIVFAPTTQAQVRPVNDYGVTGVQQMLRKLNTNASVMMIGAHPDDEDSALLAYLSRHDQARTVYLSLTRGDGGQNIIGPELFESLGVIRTEELLQARRLDGAQQLFGRAFDYGFSKTLAEARSKWDEKIVLCDVVRAIRNYRPLVVISRFSGTPADGHGQHQYAGYISPIAVKAAADPAQCTQSGATWQVLKFYQGFGNSSSTLQLNTGEYDPTTGRSFFEIAMEGRSQHKSQGEGRLELHGDQFSGLNLKESQMQRSDSEKSIYDGIDTSIIGTGKISGDSSEVITPKLKRLQDFMAAAQEDFEPQSPGRILPTLVEGVQAARDVEWSSRNPVTKSLMQRKQAELLDAIRAVAGIKIDALSNKETIVPGESMLVSTKVFFPEWLQATVKEINIKSPRDWSVGKAEKPKAPASGFFRPETGRGEAFFNVGVPADAGVTQPYWLESPREGDLFSWPADGNQNLPFQPSPVEAEVKLEIDGQELTLTQPVQYRYADEARGEIRRDVNVVPALSISVDQKLLIVSESTKPQTRRIVMTVETHSEGAIHGQAGLSVHTNPEWRTVSSNAAVDLKKKGEKTSVVFDVTIPAKTPPGAYSISPQVGVGEGLASDEMHEIEYPHIQTHRYYTRAIVNVTVLDLKVAPVRVGYIMGSGDQVPDAIRQMGLDIKMLDEREISSGDLSKYDVIVVGVRASEVRDDFVAHAPKLLEYMNNGGTMIVQYQRPSYADQGLTPFPAKQGPRVVDENANVTILDPAHPIFNFPNKITGSDFSGWVQERNLYNFGTFDPKYTPLLEAHDAGEAENNGGLVIADVGKGKYVYCSYSLFRQLPAGVGGAYRLFANMLSLPKAVKSAGAK